MEVRLRVACAIASMVWTVGLVASCNVLSDDVSFDGPAQVDGGTNLEACEQPLAWYRDGDGDGYGDPRVTRSSCSQPQGYVPMGTDCDDQSSDIHPGVLEICDGLDNNCDAVVDDDAIDKRSWARDSDGDQYGDATRSVLSCERPDGYAALDGDCDDEDPEVYPTAPESCDEVIDRNCDGSTGDADVDGDGVIACHDCNDRDPDVYPGAPELCDGKVNGCRLGVSDGSDEEGIGDPCDGPDSDLCVEGVMSCLDGVFGCSDHSGGAQELCDGLDNDCNPATLDGEGDPGLGLACDGEDDDVCLGGVVVCLAGQLECNDPGVVAETCDGADNDCDGEIDEGLDAVAWFLDGDGDGYGTGSPILSCADDLPGRAVLGEDCNDSSSAVYPGASELCDSLDNDCNGQIDDGAATETPCGVQQGVCEGSTGPCEGCTATDYSDHSTEWQPAEALCDGLDNDCDGEIDEGCDCLLTPALAGLGILSNLDIAEVGAGNYLITWTLDGTEGRWTFVTDGVARLPIEEIDGGAMLNVAADSGTTVSGTTAYLSYLYGKGLRVDRVEEGLETLAIELLPAASEVYDAPRLFAASGAVRLAYHVAKGTNHKIFVQQVGGTSTAPPWWLSLESGFSVSSLDAAGGTEVGLVWAGWNPTLNAYMDWSVGGTSPDGTLGTRALARPKIEALDSAYILVREENSAVWATLIDKESGEIAVPDSLVTNGPAMDPSVVAAGPTITLSWRQQVGDEWTVRVQGFDRTLTPLAAARALSDSAPMTETSVATAPTADGGVVVAWTTLEYDGSIYLREIHADGTSPCP